MDIYYKVHVFVNQNLSPSATSVINVYVLLLKNNLRIYKSSHYRNSTMNCSYSQYFLYCINTVYMYVYMSVNPIPLRIKRLNVYNLKLSAPMAWTQREKFSSSVLHKSTTFKLQNKYVCLQNYENISLNHFVNLSLGLNCTWLNYRIHVAPTAYRTFFVTTIFEITGCTPQLYMYVRLVRHKVF